MECAHVGLTKHTIIAPSRKARDSSRICTVICGTATELVTAEESETNPPQLTLSLREAIQTEIDNNVAVWSLKERIATVQEASNTNHGQSDTSCGVVNLVSVGFPAQ